jgi:phospholipid-binding lipoprotein MlaA
MNATGILSFIAPRRALAAALLLAAAALLAGCATGPHANPRDPLEPMNRRVTEFNEGVDAVLLKPVATVYRTHVPALVRTGVSNFFGNLGDLWSAANSLMQLKIQNAAENFMRFNVNTFFGLGGLLDIASDMNLERHREDFGQTLGRWGVPAGPYLVLPLLGPSTLRDTLALPVDSRNDLVRRIDPQGTENALIGLRAVDQRANLLRATGVLEEAALDKYSFTRDAYLQRRRTEIVEGTKAEGGDGEGREPEEPGRAIPPGLPPEPAPGQPAPPANR